MKEYLVPTRAAEAEFTEKRSTFIGHVWPVETEAEAQARIAETKKQHHDARHNCWCYLVRDGGLVRYSDDGEPQGTAGQPMLNVFQREGVENVVCVVTRYFGGILLGAGGLVRAYTAAAKQALGAAGISVMRAWTRAALDCPYPLYERVRLEIRSCGGAEEDTDFGASVRLTVLLPEPETPKLAQTLTELSAGALRLEPLGTEYRALPRRAGTALD